MTQNSTPAPEVHATKAPLWSPAKRAQMSGDDVLEVIPTPHHRWAINEDPNAPSRHQTSTGRPDHCLTCGVVRYPLSRWASDIAAGPCPGTPLKG